MRYCGRIVSTIGLLFICLCGSAKEIRTIQVITDDTKLYREIRDADSVVISWDAPSVIDSVHHFELLYRSRSDTGWSVLRSNITNLVKPEAVIYRNQINSSDSIFYFGVRSVSNSGFKSILHSSEDFDAAPSGGWILIWKR